jgi:phosphatidylserine/phosphatidylglycerophosphate/cardiolipin synthase-like enzyme
MKINCLILLIFFVLSSCTGISTTETVPNYDNSTGNDIEVFFSDPSNMTGSPYNYGLETKLVDAIGLARISIDVAIYSINLWDIRDALMEAKDRGVLVRLVTDSENFSDEVIQQLMDSGIKVIGDRRESLMHNKFVVIDRQDVWTGSMNFTVGSAYYDNNNLVHIHSNKIAMDYVTEFNEMFELDLFGDNIAALTPDPLAIVGNTLVEVYFSPDDGVADHIVSIINQGKESIIFLAYSFTSDTIGEVILDKFQKGITVSGIMDSGQAKGNQGSEFDSFQKAGVNVFLDGNSGLMHHKVIIIDKNTVITGSYNFSRSAEKENDENILILHDPRIAELFYDEFLNLISTLNNN